MRLVIQRVKKARVHIHLEDIRSIEQGLMVLVGVEEVDTKEDAYWLAQKTAQLRIFPDQDGKMNLSVRDIAGEVLVVSQFTLFAQTAKGNRPSFIRSAKIETAIPLYEHFIQCLVEDWKLPVKTGEFGADMDIELTNHGPVTITIDSKNRE